jgi:hypothetical protein
VTRREDTERNERAFREAADAAERAAWYGDNGAAILAATAAAGRAAPGPTYAPPVPVASGYQRAGRSGMTLP